MLEYIICLYKNYTCNTQSKRALLSANNIIHVITIYITSLMYIFKIFKLFIIVTFFSKQALHKKAF